MIKQKIENFLTRISKDSLDNLKFQNGCANLNLMKNLYKDITDLNQTELKIFSQNGEDGIIDYLTSQLDIKKPKFVEIGIGDYSESNTRFIYERTSAQGMIIDCLKDLKQNVSKKTKLWKGNLEIIETNVNSENILEILNTKNFLDNLDIFSLDIDGIDYWIIEKLPENFSKIVVLEYNHVFGNELKITVPNKKNFNRKDYHFSHLCFGMSIRAAIEIMEKKNFYFVGSNLFRNNAFFVSKNYLKQKFLKNLIIENPVISSEGNFRESRDKNGNLNYLSGMKKIQEIAECEVVVLDNIGKKNIKINDLFNLISTS